MRFLLLFLIAVLFFNTSCRKNDFHLSISFKEFHETKIDSLFVFTGFCFNNTNFIQRGEIVDFFPLNNDSVKIIRIIHNGNEAHYCIKKDSLSANYSIIGSEDIDKLSQIYSIIHNNKPTEERHSYGDIEMIFNSIKDPLIKIASNYLSDSFRIISFPDETNSLVDIYYLLDSLYPNFIITQKLLSFIDVFYGSNLAITPANNIYISEMVVLSREKEIIELKNDFKNRIVFFTSLSCDYCDNIKMKMIDSDKDFTGSLVEICIDNISYDLWNNSLQKDYSTWERYLVIHDTLNKNICNLITPTFYYINYNGIGEYVPSYDDLISILF